jgi:hypothetical protein
MKKVFLFMIFLYSIHLEAQISTHEEYLFYLGIYNKAYGACETPNKGKKIIRPDEVLVNMIQGKDTTKIIPFTFYSIEYPVENCFIELVFREHKIVFPADKYINSLLKHYREVYLTIYLPPEYNRESYNISYGDEIVYVEHFGDSSISDPINFNFETFFYDFIYLRIW